MTSLVTSSNCFGMYVVPSVTNVLYKRTHGRGVVQPKLPRSGFQTPFLLVTTGHSRGGEVDVYRDTGACAVARESRRESQMKGFERF